MGVKQIALTAAAASAIGLGAMMAGPQKIIEKHEGYSATTYIDPLGYATICRGHTGLLAKKGRATRAECDEATLRDLQTAFESIKRCLPPDTALTLGEWGAWISFTYNVGPGKRGKKDGFCVLKNGKEPTHLRLLKAGKGPQACAMLPSWNAQRLPGITVRRADEYALCMEDLRWH